MRAVALIAATLAPLAVAGAGVAQVTECSDRTVTRLDGVERAACFEELGWLQEAAWQHQALGDRARARAVLARLEEIFRGEPASMSVLGSGGVDNLMDTYRVRFEGGASAVFKPDLTDIGCMDCSAKHERAAFITDTILRVGLTPLTIVRELALPDGTLVEGSLQYFVRQSEQSAVHYATADEPVETDEHKPDLLRLFDVFLGNTDRHEGNWLVRSTGEIAAIDHNRAFMHDSPYGRTQWRRQLCRIRDWGALGEYVRRYVETPIEAYGPEFPTLLAPTRLAAFRAGREEVVRALTAPEPCEG